jgi:putative two-component system response regulator
MIKNKIVFLIDDNMTNLMMGKGALKDTYKTFTMPSAEKMFELLKNIRPDIILLDVMMPGMTGIEAIKILKSGEYKDIPVLFLTGTVDEGMEKQCRELGAADYIQKPFTVEDILARVNKITA